MNISLFEFIKQKKNSLEKFLRYKFIKQVSIKDVTEDIKPLILSENKIPTPEIKRMVFSNFSNSSNVDSSEFYDIHPIYTATLKDVIYYAKYYSLFTKSRKLILESVGHYTNHFKPDQFSLNKLYFSQVETLPGVYSTIRAMTNHKNYYHCLIDYIPRVYLLDQPRYKNEEIKLLLCSSPTQTENFFLKKLLPNHIKPMIIDPNRLYCLEKVIFPSMMTRRQIGYLPRPYIEYLISKVAPLRKRNRKNRIFISRSKSKTRRIHNEDELFTLLENYGFKKYYLEELPIEQQIELFYDAEAVIATHGAGLANLIFSSNIKVLELFPTSKCFFHYYYLSKALNHCYDYWSNPEGFTKNVEEFTVNLSEISKFLKTLKD
ncbi:MAG: glycosyltransferase family 61 protein [Crocosphaera sp.]|nr:glycosyltransferase family 61 protein [Crocosphaera sp.]